MAVLPVWTHHLQLSHGALGKTALLHFQHYCITSAVIYCVRLCPCPHKHSFSILLVLIWKPAWKYCFYREVTLATWHWLLEQIRVFLNTPGFFRNQFRVCANTVLFCSISSCSSAFRDSLTANCFAKIISICPCFLSFDWLLLKELSTLKTGWRYEAGFDTGTTVLHILLFQGELLGCREFSSWEIIWHTFVLVCHSFADRRDVYTEGFAQYYTTISCFSKLGVCMYL